MVSCTANLQSAAALLSKTVLSCQQQGKACAQKQPLWLVVGELSSCCYCCLQRVACSSPTWGKRGSRSCALVSRPLLISRTSSQSSTQQTSSRPSFTGESRLSCNCSSCWARLSWNNSWLVCSASATYVAAVGMFCVVLAAGGSCSQTCTQSCTTDHAGGCGWLRCVCLSGSA